MLSVKNNMITITKGDSAALNVALKKKDGTVYEMTEGDSLTMTVRKTPKSDVLLQTTSTSNIIDLIPAQTSLLEVGDCCYDIELKTSAGDVFTVAGLDRCQRTNMCVVAEITVE